MFLTDLSSNSSITSLHNFPNTPILWTPSANAPGKIPGLKIKTNIKAHNNSGKALVTKRIKRDT